jgi:hypothetical protein
MSAANKPVKEDFLEEDPEISSQKYALLSFISPENVLAKKDLFFFQQFLKDYEIQWKTRRLETFLAQQVAAVNRTLDEKSTTLESAGQGELAETVRGCRVKVDDIISGFASYVKSSTKEIKATTVQDDYSDFIFRMQEKLEDEFFTKNEFRTTVRGMKVRGVYSTTTEAEQRAKKLQRSDPLHNIFIGEVGKWLPWDPSPNAIANQEYAEDQLNTLMKKYKENDEAKENFYRENKLQKPSAQVFGAEAGAGDSEVSNSFEGMFGAAGDLAIERKKAAAAAAVVEAAEAVVDAAATVKEEKID